MQKTYLNIPISHTNKCCRYHTNIYNIILCHNERNSEILCHTGRNKILLHNERNNEIPLHNERSSEMLAKVIGTIERNIIDMQSTGLSNVGREHITAEYAPNMNIKSHEKE